MKPVLVIGDIILDHYIEGRADRLSPEAPVPVIEVMEERYVLGGAANVAANVVSLGARAILLGLTGDDQSGERIRSLAKEQGIDVRYVLSDAARVTTEKCRLLSGSHQVARYDREIRSTLHGDIMSQLLNALLELQDSYSAVVISDYGKGAVPPGLFSRQGVLSSVPIILDPKQPGFLRFCPAGSIIKPNKKEAEQESGLHISGYEDALVVADLLRTRLEALAVYVTLGAEGGALSSALGHRQIVPTQRIKVYDPTGAGDTAAAALAIGLAEGRTLPDAARQANRAASVAVLHPGTTAVSWDMVRELAEAQP